MASSTSSDAAKVLVVCRTFLAGIKARSPAQMRSVILPGGHGTLIRPTAEGKREVLRLTMDGVIDRIPFDRQETEIEETIAGTEWEDDVGMLVFSICLELWICAYGRIDGDTYGGRKSKVEVDGDLAVAWTPYVVLIGGKLHHEGTNIFNLLKIEEGEWKISGVADTYRLVKSE